MALPPLEVYEFGPFRIDIRERLLHRGNEVVPLPPKVADTLVVLVSNAGRMIDKNDLLKSVWPDTFVEEGALTRNISLLRKTLGDTGDEPVYIATIPKRGYRFLAPVRIVENHDRISEEIDPAETRPPIPPRPGKARGKGKWILAAAAGIVLAWIVLNPKTARNAAPAPAANPPSTVLAVLPFRNLGPGESPDYFAEGITQAIVTSLANIGNLRVVSLASDLAGDKDAAVWKVILRDRAVHRVLTGTVTRSGGRVRINAQLLDPATRAVYWANQYERLTEDILDLESDVAEAIAREIQVNTTIVEKERFRTRHSKKPEAMDAYLRGLSLWNRRTEDSLRRAAEHFSRATALDPGYALAWAGLADSYSLLGSIGTDGMPPHQAMPLAKSAAQKSIALRPDLADGHISLAYVKLSYDWDLAAAAQEFALALKLNPNSATGHHWYSHYFMAAGDLANASEQMRQAQELEPLSPSINIGVGWCLYYQRDYDRAIERFRTVVEMDPELPLAHQTLGMAYQQKGDIARALEEFRKAADYSGNSAASVAALASAYAKSGRGDEAARQLARLRELAAKRYVPAIYFASVHHAMGDVPGTLKWGWASIGERCDYLMYLGVEPSVGALARHPEFIRAMAVLGK